jgi:hypothetical protein
MGGMQDSETTGTNFWEIKLEIACVSSADMMRQKKDAFVSLLHMHLLGPRALFEVKILYNRQLRIAVVAILGAGLSRIVFTCHGFGVCAKRANFDAPFCELSWRVAQFALQSRQRFFVAKS